MTETNETMEAIRRRWIEAQMGSGRPEWMYAMRPGDRVTISTPHGGKQRGKVVMAGPGGWVINCGGKWGTPAIADETNILRVARKEAA